MASNKRLENALEEAGFTVYDLAAAVKVDPKTVQRWISNGSTPYSKHRIRTAELLSCDSDFLWPPDATVRPVSPDVPPSLLEMFPHRTSVPTELWQKIPTATKQIDMLVYAAGFLYEQIPNYVAKLCEQGRNDVRIRLLLGDPNGALVALRGDEEQISGPVARRARRAIEVYTDACNHSTGCDRSCIQIRIHDTVLYNSIYRFDNEMIVNTHIYGAIAANAPTLHLRNSADDTVFAQYLASYEKVWSLAKPLKEA